MRTNIWLFAAPVLALGIATLTSFPAHADGMPNAGVRQIMVDPGPREPAPTPVVLFYPTATAAQTLQRGPFTLTAAPEAPPEPTVKGLIVLSHGTGGSELGHAQLAQALARSGYLVAALRHPGDNWQDTSLRDGPEAVRYFTQRPAQVSHVIDALLRDPLWKDRIAADSRGPRIGVLGHSAGGYTALALAGGRPDMARLQAHCQAEAAQDPIFCSLGRKQGAPAVGEPGALPALADARVRAVAALAPVGVPLTAASLAAITVPTLLVEAGADRFLVGRFHAGWVAQNAPRAQHVRVPGALHFAFMDKPAMPLPTPDGDIGADAPGFDRAAFLAQLGPDLARFFDRAW